MDLALELGMPAELLARTMTEREFHRWHKYAEKKMLPTRRLELYMAQVAQLIAITMGGAKDVTLDDFVWHPAAIAPPDDGKVDLEALKAAFQFAPRKKKG